MTPFINCWIALALLAADGVSGELNAEARVLRPAGIDIEQIIDTWRERQDRILSLKFTWSQPFCETGRWRNYQADWPAKGDVESKPPENVLSIQGDMVRYETNRWYAPITMEYAGFTEPEASFYTRDEKFFRLYFHDTPALSFRSACNQKFSRSVDQMRNPRRFVSVRNGSRRIDLFSKGDGKYAQSAIFDWKASCDGLNEIQDTLYFRPILLAYRPLFPGAGSIHPGDCRIINERSYVNGRTCVVVQESKPGDLKCTYWVDSERDGVITRAIFDQQGKTRAQLDIWYRESQEDRWIPASWTAMLIPKEANYLGHDWLVHEAAAHVDEFALNDSVTDATVSDITIPPGTLVLDHVEHTTYIALGENRKRIVTESEARSKGVTYERILGDWSSEVWNDVRIWLSVGIAGCLVIIAAERIRQRRWMLQRSNTAAVGLDSSNTVGHPILKGRLRWVMGCFCLWGSINAAYCFFADQEIATELTKIFKDSTSSTIWIWWVSFWVFAIAAAVQFRQRRS